MKKPETTMTMAEVFTVNRDNELRRKYYGAKITVPKEEVDKGLADITAQAKSITTVLEDLDTAVELGPGFLTGVHEDSATKLVDELREMSRKADIIRLKMGDPRCPDINLKDGGASARLRNLKKSIRWITNVIRINTLLIDDLILDIKGVDDPELPASLKRAAGLLRMEVYEFIKSLEEEPSNDEDEGWDLEDLTGLEE